MSENINNYKKLLDSICDYIEEEEFDKVRNLLGLNGFDSVEELEDAVKALVECELKCAIIKTAMDEYKKENK